MSTANDVKPGNQSPLEADLQAIAEGLLAAGAVQFGEFTLTSGRKSSYYVNLKAALAEPDLLWRVAAAIHARLPAQAGCVAGMELGAVPIAVATALAAQLPYALIRKAGRSHGTGSRVEGALSQQAVVVEDVATTGGSLVEALEVLEALDTAVLATFVVVDREEGAAEAMAAKGYTLQPLLTITQLNQLRSTGQKAPTRQG